MPPGEEMGGMCGGDSWTWKGGGSGSLSQKQKLGGGWGHRSSVENSSPE